MTGPGQQESLIEGIDTRKGIIAWFAHNSVAANLLMFFIFMAGLLSMSKIERTMMPAVELDTVNIQTIYPGATPQEMETGVVLKIEEAIKDIDGIKHINATAMEGIAQVKVDVVDDAEFGEVMAEIKVAVDGIASFPEQAEKPIVTELQWRQFALVIQIYGELSEAEMKQLADEARLELQKDSSIGLVETLGARDYEISVEIRARDLRQYDLTLGQVANKIRESSLDLPGGAIKTANGDILLRTRGQAYRQQDFEQVVLITYPDGTRLTLADIAVIRDSFQESTGFAIYDGQYSVGMNIYASPGRDIIDAAEAAKRYIKQRQQTLPQGVYMDYWADVTFYLQDRISMMMKNLGLGALLVLLVLTLFLDIKLAFWVMVGLPICFLGAFALLPLEGIGVTLNMFSLFGFILVLGIVVDDAIIIGESAGRYAEKYGHSVDAVVAGARRVATPATFGVLTTIMAFLPTLATDTRMSAMPESFGWVVILCLIFSLIESKWILPAHLAHAKPAVRGPLTWLQPLQRGSNRILQTFIQKIYAPVINVAIRGRYITGAFFIGLLLIVGGLVAGGIVRVIIMPDVQSDFIEVTMEMVEGSSDQQTVDAFVRVYQALQAADEELAELGHPPTEHSFFYAYGGRNINGMVELSKNTDRNITTSEIADMWRANLGQIPGIKVLSISAAQDDFGEAIGLRLIGPNEEELRNAAAELSQKLSSYNGLFDIRNGAKTAQDEIVLSLRPAADSAGVSVAELANQVRHAFYGAEAQRVQRGIHEVKVMVRYPREERSAVANLQDMYVRSSQNEYLPLTSVADTTIQAGYTQLQRIDNERSIAVTSEANKAVAEPDAILRELKESYLPSLKAKYPSIDYSTSGQSEDSEKLLNQMFIGFAMALLGVYALLAIPLRSYFQPLIIMSVIPFGLIGAICGHLIMGQSMNMMSLMGVIALTGVVVNDSLIMVDFINRKISEGSEVLAAIIGAGTERFRPILLTSITTFVGLSPMLLEKSVQAKMIQPMAVSLAFGIIFSTVITLIMVPCLYAMREDLKHRKFQAFKEGEPGTAQPA